MTMLSGILELSEKSDAGYHTTFILKFEQYPNTGNSIR
jgi:hypothetical protein